MGWIRPFISRVARYTPSSRSRNASKIKANLEFHKSSDDFIKKYGVSRMMNTIHFLLTPYFI